MAQIHGSISTSHTPKVRYHLMMQNRLSYPQISKCKNMVPVFSSRCICSVFVFTGEREEFEMTK